MGIILELEDSNGAASAATAMVDIRDLSPRRTLVLIDGHRISSLENEVPDDVGDAPPNALPFRQSSKLSRNIGRMFMQSSRGKGSSGEASLLRSLLFPSGRGIAAVAGLGASLLSIGAFAQVAADNNNPQQQLTEIVVTGSHLNRTDTETPSPVQIITADDLKQSGYTNTQEVLKNLTANGQGTLSQSFSGAFASGAAGVALRGLNVGYTLTLIDNHRMAPFPIGDDGQRSFVDIASIPFDSIDHIDVLKDGASSAYGSDAIAGVVNVVLRSEERRVGKECLLECRSRWSPDH